MTEQRPITYYDFFDKIRNNLRGYLHDSTLSALREYVEKAFREKLVVLRPVGPDAPRIDLFGDWAARRLGMTKKSYTGDWERLSADFWAVISMAAENDAQALDSFFCLLDEFRRRKTVIAAEVRLQRPLESRQITGLKAIRLYPDPGYYLFCEMVGQSTYVQPLEKELGFYESINELFERVRMELGIEPAEWHVFE